jgi:uncharacterized protein (TIGR02145 family)
MISCLFLLKCTQTSTPYSSPDQYSIYLTGRVLDKDGKPMPNIIAKLIQQDIGDTTDVDGYYSISQPISHISLKSMANNLDTIQLFKDGQIITGIEISMWIDTLPDVFIVQRDIYGNLPLETDSQRVIKAVITGENISDSTPKIVELWHNLSNNSYSGFVYLVYTPQLTHYSVYINIYDNQAHLTGRSVKVNFPSTAGDINIPSFDPNNAKPTVVAGEDTTVDSSSIVHLYGKAIDSIGEIVKWEWDFGNTGTFKQTSTSDTIIQVPPSVRQYQCIIKATDDDGNIVKDTMSVSVFGYMVDIEGNSYRTIIIGNQEWTVENLRTTKLNDGSTIKHVPDSSSWCSLSEPGYCAYKNSTDANFIKKHGFLYNFCAVDSNRIAPKGWHVPTHDEFDSLENYIIRSKNIIPAKALASNTDWEISTNYGAVGNDLSKNNLTGFSAFPSGYRNNSGAFSDFGNSCLLAGRFALDYASYNTQCFLTNYVYEKITTYGFSVRLVKN